jgi:hypothetical protein
MVVPDIQSVSNLVGNESYTQKTGNTFMSGTTINHHNYHKCRY